MLPACDVVVEMVGGVEPAFRTAMAALGTGTACIVTSPMLVAAHGRMLASAAEGMHCFLGVSAAGVGTHVEKMAAGSSIRKATLLWSDGGRALMDRMGFRNESLARMRADLERGGMDLSDAGGKLTQARAAAVLGACGAWPRVSSQVRVGVDAVEPADMRKMRELGLGVVYGAVLEGGRMYVGPLAVALDSPLLGERGRDVVMLDTDEGEVMWSRECDERARVLGGVMTDARDFLKWKQTGVEQASGLLELAEDDRAALCYVRLASGRREAVLANVERVMEERVDSDGMWQAVVKGIHIGRLRLLASDGLALPLTGKWEASVGMGLRLVS